MTHRSPGMAGDLSTSILLEVTRLYVKAQRPVDGDWQTWWRMSWKAAVVESSASGDPGSAGKD